VSHRFQRSILTWRTPPNWSPRDWLEELKAEIIAATWEAERDFDPARGVPVEAFIQQRVWARSLNRYRREWAYARHCVSHLEDINVCDTSTDGGFPLMEIGEILEGCLRRLPNPQRRLIEGLFWEEQTEVEVARMLSLSQPAISKRKRRILERLRRWMARTEIIARPETIEALAKIE
jgi:RNA polymerase sigma factor (sigma-70 family)